MATEFNTEYSLDYYNKVKVEIRAAKSVSGDDMKTIQDAINTIDETITKYFEVEPEEEAGNGSN